MRVMYYFHKEVQTVKYNAEVKKYLRINCPKIWFLFFSGSYLFKVYSFTLFCMLIVIYVSETVFKGISL